MVILSRPECTPNVRWGDLLPLPMPPQPLRSGDLARTERRRAQRSDADLVASQETVFALNTVAGHPDAAAWPSGANQAQHRSLERIQSLHSRRVWPKGGRLEPRASLTKLLRRSSNYGAATGSLACYEPGSVSLPSGSESLCSLIDTLDPTRAFYLENFESQMMKYQQ